MALEKEKVPTQGRIGSHLRNWGHYVSTEHWAVLHSPPSRSEPNSFSPTRLTLFESPRVVKLASLDDIAFDESY
ncbi:hypothetical protein QQP08_024166 [Theobroma cacao]|nr:hypothetical protein QQP08_024166 [Theobroma cacao]